MPLKSETRAGKARASRTSCGGWFRDSLTLSHNALQPIPSLIALHVGASLLVRWTKGAVMADRYPGIPGAKGADGTSQDAANAIAPTVTHLRRLALLVLAGLGEATVLEAVAAAGVARESLQPRFSELRSMGLVESTGARRRNPSGRYAAVLRLTEDGRAMLDGAT